MNKLSYILLIFVSINFTACGQATTKEQKKTTTIKTDKMNTENITNAIVKSAIDALQKGDKTAWYALFTDNAEMTDDENTRNFKKFSDDAIGHERFTSIDKVENDGKDIYGHFHSDQWGDFKTYFKFHINSEGKITKLDIGQAN